MSDRLTQLQICLDQLIEQFNATINYVNLNATPALLDDDEPKSIINLASQAPAPPQQQQPNQPQPNSKSTSQPPVEQDPEKKEKEFENTLDELSTDLILKSRQINMLIDSLPGIGSTPEYQLEMISKLNKELQDVEQERIEKIKEKDVLLQKVESLIETLAIGITNNKI